METQMSYDTATVSRKKKKKLAKRPNGRPLMFPDKTIVRMPKGFLARINKIRKRDGDLQGDFMRVAVERELERREQRK
jgi:hypothetical protein